ncbi:hypothetical protein LOAG_06565 [Loa loa]|uniref:Uncharacterized protein n=1 Tax=Loa loa TaxID=7209 RepID=A0A1S0TXK3_LOALO|nr:hypothetical protein LOAG_06565 [Loa loa]EFO21923.2 hypothetical protein LOAG_06565 [Loa loa]
MDRIQLLRINSWIASCQFAYLFDGSYHSHQLKENSFWIGVAGIGFIALTYLIAKIYSDKIKGRLLCPKKKTKHFIAVRAVQRQKSILTFQKFSRAGRVHTESSEKILTCPIEPLREQLTKRVRMAVEGCKDKLDSRSSSSSPKIEKPFCASLPSISSPSRVQRRKTL